MLRRGVVLLALCAVLGAFAPDALAHATLRLSDPLAGATLGDTPRTLRLTFSEKPEPSLSIVRVVDTGGVAYQIGKPEPVSGDPLSLVTRIRPLGRGVYTVSWRVVSSFDGHATAGAFAFGVRVAPAMPATAATAQPASSRLEMLARFVLIVGLVVLLGAAVAAVARFGGESDLALGAGGWLVAVMGLVLLADAQRRGAATTFGGMLKSPFGRALIWRAVGFGIAALALGAARWTRPPLRRVAMVIAILAVSMVIAAHVSAGHAAASRWLPAASIAVQSAHFAATGIWLGGLAALLLGVRGAPSAAKSAAVRRFSNIAAAGMIVVAVTGIVRAVEALGSWRDLAATGYGRGVSAKIALLVIVAAFGALNRWRSVPATNLTLRRLRRTSGGELAFAVGALAAAAVLGSLPPPSGGLHEPAGLEASGEDFGTTVRVRLTTPSDQPGPNRFVVEFVDYDSKLPVRARRSTLEFTPLDDPEIESTTLLLEPAPGDVYVGTGPNLAFDGRWRITLRIETPRDSVEVPLDVEVRSASRFLSVERVPGEAPKYNVQVTGGSFVRISPDPERAGRSRVSVTCFDTLGEERPIERVIITITPGVGPTRQSSARRLNGGLFVADVELRKGRNTVAAVVRTADGARLRASVELDVPGD